MRGVGRGFGWAAGWRCRVAGGRGGWVGGRNVTRPCPYAVVQRGGGGARGTRDAWPATRAALGALPRLATPLCPPCPRPLPIPLTPFPSPSPLFSPPAPPRYWQSKLEKSGKSPLQDPAAIIGIVAIFFPFVILGIAIATGVVDLEAGRGGGMR